MKSCALILLSLSIVSGCGKKTMNSSTDLIYLNSGETLNSYTKSLILDEKTPEGVGTILTLHEGIYSQQNMSLCTAFLVGPDRVLTNSHCIPEKLKADSNLPCGDYLQGSFQTSLGQKKFRCKKLLFFSDISRPTILNNDYALLELEKAITSDRVFGLDRRGVVEDQKLKVLTMNHQQLSGGIYSEYKEHTCLMKSSDLLGKITSPGVSPVTGFREEKTDELCKTINGNSGSPVIDSEGRLIAILHGGMKEGQKYEAGMELASNDLTSNISIMTNLRCQLFKQPGMDADLPATCEEERRENGLDQKKIMKSLEPKVAAEVEKILLKQPSYLQYHVTYKEQGTETLVHFIPKCVKPLTDWDEESLRQIKTEGFLSKSRTILAQVPQYKMGFMMSLNYYGNLIIDPKMRDFGTIQISISSLDGLKEKGHVISTVDMTSLGIRQGMQTRLVKCSGAPKPQLPE